MTEPTLTERVTILEQKVNEFASLPSRVAGVELQIVQLRDEMQGGFSAVRQEMAVLRDDLRSELHHELHGIREELGGIRGELSGVRGELDGIHGTLSGVRAELDGIRGELDGIRGELNGLRGLRAEIREGDEETRRFMRVLHEDLIVRIAALGDARG
jgi:chromosome segregation ATPase